MTPKTMKNVSLISVGDKEEESFENRPFPTLRQCFEQVEPYIGFNVEIKYPQKMKVCLFVLKMS